MVTFPVVTPSPLPVHPVICATRVVEVVIVSPQIYGATLNVAFAESDSLTNPSYIYTEQFHSSPRSVFPELIVVSVVNVPLLTVVTPDVYTIPFRYHVQ